MKQRILLTLLIALPLYSVAQDAEISVSETTDQLVGEWKIDLRPTPDAEAYYQVFAVEAVDGNSIVGTFYGSEIKNALLNKNWSKTYFAFSTSDASSEYYHSGYIANDTLHGMTYCPNRDFAAPWTGVKE